MRNALRKALERRRESLAAFRQRFTDTGDDSPLLDEATLRDLNGLSLQSGRALTEWLFGEHPGRRRTQALEFADYRGYVPGDDFRQIDWNAYARLGDLVVKTSQTLEVITLSLLVDCSRSMDWGRPNKLRYGKRLSALLGALALMQSDLVQLYALGDGDAHPGALLSGPGALRTLVEELDTMPSARATDLPGSLAAVRQSVDMHGLIVLVSDMLVPREQLAALPTLTSEDAMVTVLHLVDTAESLPSERGPVTLRDSESGDSVSLAITPALRRRYLDRAAAHSQELAAICATSGAGYLRVDTSVEPADVMAGLFKEEGIVQA